MAFMADEVTILFGFAGSIPAQFIDMNNTDDVQFEDLWPEEKVAETEVNQTPDKTEWRSFGVNPVFVAKKRIKLTELKRHPLNIKLYGDVVDHTQTMLEIEKCGLQKPIVVDTGNVIIDGSVRVDAYMALGETDIEAHIYRYADEHEQEAHLILLNETKKKSKEMLKL